MWKCYQFRQNLLKQNQLKNRLFQKHQKKNQANKGQSLIEYLILVALMAIASIGIVKVLGQNLQGQFARVAHALKGEDRRPQLKRINKGYYKQRDLSDFFDEAANEEDE